MEPLELGIQFGAVFIGAFLAIGLENLRQARHTRKWVRRHLRQLAGWMRPAVEEEGPDRSVERLTDAIDRWMTAEKREDLDEATWNVLISRFNTMPIDFGHVLRSEAVAVLPEELGPVISKVESRMRLFDRLTEILGSVNDRDILPMVYERRAPLDDADKRRLQDYRECLVDYLKAWNSLATSVLAMLDQIERL